MTSCVFSLFFLVSLFPSIAAVHPTGVRVRITDKAQDVLKDLGLTFLEELVNKPLPDFPVHEGKILKCTIKGLTLTNLIVDPAQVLLHFQNPGLQFEIKDLSSTWTIPREVNVCLFQKDFTVNKGTNTFGGNGVSATIGVRLSQNQGRLIVHMQDCQVNAERFTISGILGVFQSDVKQYFNNELCPAVQTHAVPKINSMLESITMATTVYGDAERTNFNFSIDYSLSGDIAETPHSIDVPFKGLVSREEETVDIESIRAGTDPAFDNTDHIHMAYVGVSEFVLNSASMSLYNSGPFNLTVPETNWVVNSFLYVLGIPQGPVEVELTEAPTFSIKQDGISGSVKARVQSLREPQKPPYPVSCQVDLKLDIKGNHVSPESHSIWCNSETLLGKLVSGVVNIGISIWKFFTDGYPLPLPKGLSLTHGKIKYHHGYVVIEGDLHFTSEGKREVARKLLKLIKVKGQLD